MIRPRALLPRVHGRHAGGAQRERVVRDIDDRDLRADRGRGGLAPEARLQREHATRSDREAARGNGALFGIKAAVLVIVVEALIRIGKRALKTSLLLGLAAAAFICRCRSDTSASRSASVRYGSASSRTAGTPM